MGRSGLSQHRKFRRLARDLNSEAIARGSLELLCDSCYENGDDYLGDSRDLEAAARWAGDPGALTDALAGAGRRPLRRRLEIDEFNRRFAAGCWIKISEHLHITSDYHEKKVGPQRVQR